MAVFWHSFSHGHLHPMLWGCVPIVVILISVNCLMGTYTLRCRDASLWSYFISDSAISWVPPPYTVGMRPHSRISFSVNNLMGTYTLRCGDASPWLYLVSRISFRHQIVTSFHFSRAPTPTHFCRLVSTPKPVSQLVPAWYQCPCLPTLALDPPTTRLSPPTLDPNTRTS